MAYYDRAAGRAQGKMLAYARDCLDKKTYERILKANGRVTVGIYIYIIILMSLLFVPVFFLGKISTGQTIVCVLAACLSPIIYLPIYYNTFGKEWNQYVKWYTKTDRTSPFIFEGDTVSDKAVSNKKVSDEVNSNNVKSGALTSRLQAFKSYPIGISNAKIVDVRGDMYSVRIKYDNGYEIKVSGELFPGGKFIAYNKSMTKWEAPHDAEEFTFEDAKKIITDMLDRYETKMVDIVFDGDFSIADMRGRAVKNKLVKYNSGLEGVSDTWIVRPGDIDLENKTVSLRFYKGHLPGWKVEDKTECSKVVSLDEITGYAIQYCYIYSTKAGQRVSEYCREIPCDLETICKQG